MFVPITPEILALGVKEQQAIFLSWFSIIFVQ